VRELRQLGVEINPQYVAQLEVTMEQRRLERQRRKQQREGNGIEEHAIDSDDTFAYIAGYTSGGAPYGLTWEQWDGLEDDWEQLEDADSDEAS
jgi:hypothetical protein